MDGIGFGAAYYPEHVRLLRGAVLSLSVYLFTSLFLFIR
jgi:hypothetical protein